MAQTPLSLAQLPLEILLMVSEDLTFDDISAWLRTSTFFAKALEPFIYSRIATHPCSSGRSVLEWAAKTGQISVIEKISASATPSNIPVETSTQALCYAAKNNHLDAARLLLNMGANVNDRACIYLHWEYTALHQAAEANHIEMAQLLLENGADIQATGSASGGRFSDDTVLELAVLHSDLDMIKFLLDAGADITTGGVIRRAAQSKRLDILGFLLDKGARLQGPYENSTPHLWWAIAQKQRPLSKFLLERGVDPNEQFTNGTAMHVAADLGDVDAAQMLLDYGAEVNLVDIDARSPLHMSARMPEIDPQEPYSRESIVAFLLDHGADPFLLDEDGNPPLLDAKIWGNKRIIKCLKDKMKELRPEETIGVTDESDDEEEDDDWEVVNSRYMNLVIG